MTETDTRTAPLRVPVPPGTSLLVRLLLEQGALEAKDLPEIEKALAQQNVPAEQALIEAELVSDVAIAKAYAQHLRLPLADCEKPLPLNKEEADRIGEKVCRERCHRCRTPTAPQGTALAPAGAASCCYSQ